MRLRQLRRERGLLIALRHRDDPSLLDELQRLQERCRSHERETLCQRPCILVRCLDDDSLHQKWSLSGLDLLDLNSWDMRRLYGV